MTQNVSYTIKALRFPLVVLVVFIHSFGAGEYTPYHISFSCISSYDFYNIIRITISHVIALVAVPLFFIISGYLFYVKLENWDWNIWKKKIKSRFYTLLIPYVVWSFLRIIFNRFVNLYSSEESLSVTILSNTLSHKIPLYGTFWHYTYADTDITSWFGFISPLSVPYHVPLWFIRDLIVLVFLSPVLYKIIKLLGIWCIIILGGIYISFLWPQMQFINIKSVFFFSLGAFVSIKKIDFLKCLGFIKKKEYVFAIPILTILMVYYDGFQPIHSIIMPWFILLGVAGIFMLFSENKQLQKWRLFHAFSDMSFFIFASHVFILIILSRIEEGYIDMNTNPFILISLYFINPIISISTSILIFVILKKYMPITLKVLNGRIERKQAKKFA